MVEFSVSKLSTILGCEVHGVDLGSEISKETAAFIYGELVKHGLLVFRGQDISPSQQVKIGRLFGQPVVPLNVYESFPDAPEITVLHADAKSSPDTDIWHVDSSFREEPPFATILSSVIVPPLGGDTIFACMRSALRSLPPGFRNDIQGLFAVHEVGDLKNHFSRSKEDHHQLIKGLRDHGAAIHPIVYAHPHSLEDVLYVNETYTSHVLGLNAGENRRVLNYLFDLIKTPELHYRHRWEEGMVVIWDNRLVQHYAVADYLPQTRTMHRLTLINDLHLHEVSD
ncbi:TauD/TfdA family dioxygenase [Candidatus Kaiserbacteria bacterium]|nr:TauD/TfdA family dioxygenase [Candidatus Kaiserbacteria bacterium]